MLMLKPYMSYRINFIGNLIYLVEFMARLNSVKPILNNDITLTFPLSLYTLCVTIFSFL